MQPMGWFHWGQMILRAAGLFAFIVFAGSTFAAGPTVSNVRASQRPGTQLVDVYYDVADPDSSTLTVSVAVSTDGGVSYAPGSASFTGALGAGIAPGSNKKFTWNVGVDLPAKLFSNVRVSVTASDDTAAPLSGTSFVTVGDAGNAADAATTYGAVGYEFQIQKFEFTNGEYVEFLNAVGGSNPNGIYSTSMGADARAGITQSGASPSFTYAVKANMGDKPVNYVSWFEAARVANWLHNGRSTNPALLETGAYTLNNATSGIGFTKNAGATYWVPIENEWYKAAYYKGGSVSAGYWAYPTKSDIEPTWVTANSTGVGSAGLGSTANSINTNVGADWNGQDGNVTTVGSNGGPSAYGTYDMGGNVWEWDDDVVWGSAREVRGGCWRNPAFQARSGVRSDYYPAGRSRELGFRLARSSVP